jgi:hypothetical protein
VYIYCSVGNTPEIRRHYFLFIAVLNRKKKGKIDETLPECWVWGSSGPPSGKNS